MLNIEKAIEILTDSDQGYFQPDGNSLQITTWDKYSYCALDEEENYVDLEGFFNLKDLKVLVEILEKCWEE